MSERSIQSPDVTARTFQYGSVKVLIQRFSSGAVHIRSVDEHGEHTGWTMHREEDRRDFLKELARLTDGKAHGEIRY